MKRCVFERCTAFISRVRLDALFLQCLLLVSLLAPIQLSAQSPVEPSSDLGDLSPRLSGNIATILLTTGTLFIREVPLESTRPPPTVGGDPNDAAVATAPEWRRDFEALRKKTNALYESARLTEARAVAEEAAELVAHAAGPNAPATAVALNNLALLYQETGQYDQAFPLYKRALKIDEDTFGISHPYVAQVLSNLAGWYQSVARYESAIPLYTRALTIQQQALGPTHLATAASFGNLSMLYYSMGKYTRALELSLKAMAIREQTLGADHVDTANNLCNLGAIVRSLGRYEEALRLSEKAMAQLTNALGTSHPNTSECMNNVAMLYQQMGLYDKALGILKRALELREQSVGSNDAGTATLVGNLAEIYRFYGHNEEALTLHLRALSIRETVLGPNHPDTAESLNNLALLYSTTSRTEQAIPLYRRALAINERVFGPENPRVAINLSNLGYLYGTTGHSEPAFALAQRALVINQKTLGVEHPHTATALNNLASIHQSNGQHKKALQLFQRALLLSDPASVTETERANGSLELVYVTAGNLGYALEYWPGGGRVNEAIVFYKLSVNAAQRMRRGTLGLNRELRDSFTASVADPYRRLARLLISRGRLTEAEQVLLLLKESEMHDFVRRSEGISATYSPLRWTPDEQEFADSLAILAIDLSKQVDLMASLRERIYKGELKHDGAEWKQAESRLQRLNERQMASVRELSERIARNSHEARSKAQQIVLESRSELSSRQANLRSRDFEALRLPASVALTWLPDARGLTIIVSSAQTTRAVQVLVTEADINRAAAAMRIAIAERGDFRPPARALYRWLIAPALPLIGQSGPPVQHLMLNAIDALRDVPFAALLDETTGKYLIEGYALSLITAQSAPNLDRAPQLGWQIAGLGASKGAPDFGNVSLPAIHDELCGIVRDETCVQGAITGRRYVDPQFDRTELRHLLGQGNELVPANAVHLATHYNVKKSVMLLGSGEPLALVDLVAMDLRLSKFDLLTLSACESAVGSAGVESLAGQLQHHGAKAVLATLWAVQDEGTAKLMVDFYRRRGEQRLVTKAEALRQAQIAFLQGNIRSSDAKLDLKHPYFWAPFVLMGNWL
ncbi:CHAT domain-containing protein [Variovorax sp. J22R24]|uniref:CHAT domain-containing protein n=1 Tax=Variovorax gracilis TaxID=3053502 RepID=UPI002577727F|nr:CHAT domain-containing tetratricopeptide repeat protein [Variovorax sp. J22R24]MDM0110063.1 CHAT domain-containing protein [Variovorax sp. J22R24]